MKKRIIFPFNPISACKQLQENQAVAWISKTKEKNPPKQESLVFLERTVHRVGETAETQRKTREKTKVAENQVFWLDFCAKKKVCAYSLWTRIPNADPYSRQPNLCKPMRIRIHKTYFHVLPRSVILLIFHTFNAKIIPLSTVFEAICQNLLLNDILISLKIDKAKQ